jgi:hypothetical protein
MRNARGIAQTGTGQDIAAASLVEDDTHSKCVGSKNDGAGAVCMGKQSMDRSLRFERFF